MKPKFFDLHPVRHVPILGSKSVKQLIPYVPGPDVIDLVNLHIAERISFLSNYDKNGSFFLGNHHKGNVASIEQPQLAS